MKKRVILCALALLVMLSGCGGSGNETAAEMPYTLDDAQTLLDAGLFDGDMGMLDDSYVISMLYHIDEDSIQACVSYQAANTSVSADEVTILILKDEDAAQAAEAGCHQRVEEQIDASRNYTPAAVPRLEEAVIRRSGNTVLLAVGDPDGLAGAVDKLH